MTNEVLLSGGSVRVENGVVTEISLPRSVLEQFIAERQRSLENALMVCAGFMSAQYGDDDQSSTEIDLVFAAIDQVGDLSVTYPEALAWVDLEAYYERN